MFVSPGAASAGSTSTPPSPYVKAPTRFSQSPISDTELSDLETMRDRVSYFLNKRWIDSVRLGFPHFTRGWDKQHFTADLTPEDVGPLYQYYEKRFLSDALPDKVLLWLLYRLN